MPLPTFSGIFARQNTGPINTPSLKCLHFYHFFVKIGPVLCASFYKKWQKSTQKIDSAEYVLKSRFFTFQKKALHGLGQIRPRHGVACIRHGKTVPHVLRTAKFFTIFYDFYKKIGHSDF